jgi:hypothetical protein
MFRQSRRWRWLSLFALANLLCWVTFAVVAGMLLGDEMDLGVETLIRQRQATVVAAWNQIPRQPPRTDPSPSSTVPSQTRTPTTQASPTTLDGPPTSTRPSATRQEQTTQAVPPLSTPTPTSASQRATPEAKQTLISSPLLMSDPPISNLGNMNAEMSRSAPGRPVQIRYDETTLNREIAAMLRRNPDLPYRDIEVDLRADRVVVTGTVNVLGFQVKTEATGTLAVRACTPHMDVQSISLAGVLTPGFVKERIKEMLLGAVAWYPVDYPLCLEEIVLEETRATLYGHRR